MPGENPVSAMAPEQLFIQRAVQWVRPGGRVGIVLPNGILSNPGPTDEAIRRWILRNCWVLASVELPVEAFTQAGVNILTSLLFLKKKTSDEMEREAMAEAIGKSLPDYPVFMAVAEKVGKDRRGNRSTSAARTARLSLSCSRRPSACGSGGRITPARSTGWLRLSTTTSRRSRGHTEHSVNSIPSRVSKGDHPAGGLRLSLLPVP